MAARERERLCNRRLDGSPDGTENSIVGIGYVCEKRLRIAPSV